MMAINAASNNIFVERSLPQPWSRPGPDAKSAEA